MAEKVARRKPRFWLEKNGAMTHTDCLWAESCFRKASFRLVIVVCATALNWSGTCRQAEPGFPTGDCCLQAESSSRKDPWGILLRSNFWSCGLFPLWFYRSVSACSRKELGRDWASLSSRYGCFPGMVYTQVMTCDREVSAKIVCEGLAVGRNGR